MDRFSLGQRKESISFSESKQINRMLQIGCESYFHGASFLQNNHRCKGQQPDHNVHWNISKISKGFGNRAKNNCASLKNILLISKHTHIPFFSRFSSYLFLERKNIRVGERQRERDYLKQTPH